MQTNVRGATALGEVDMSGDLHLLQHLLPLVKWALQQTWGCSRTNHTEDNQNASGYCATGHQKCERERDEREGEINGTIYPSQTQELSLGFYAAVHSGFVIVRVPRVKRKNSKLEITNTAFTKDDGTCLQWRVLACLFQGKMLYSRIESQPIRKY